LSQVRDVIVGRCVGGSAVGQDVGVDLTSPEMIVASASVVLSLASGLLSARTSRKARLFEVEVARQERQIDAAERAERLLNEYREPLIDAAHTLQSRLFNIIQNSYLDRFYLHAADPDQRDYARDYTVYAIAEYLTWSEILRREMRFQDVGDTAGTQDLMHRLTNIQYQFQRHDLAGPFELFRGRQRAIAEVMMVPTGMTDGPRNEPIGYATFCRRLTTGAEFAGWFAHLQRDVEVVANGTPEQNVRLTYLQHHLVDLMDFLDEKKVRIPAQFRRRLPEPAAIPAQR
jgi:hypothetical protein